MNTHTNTHTQYYMSSKVTKPKSNKYFKWKMYPYFHNACGICIEHAN